VAAKLSEQPPRPFLPTDTPQRAGENGLLPESSVMLLFEDVYTEAAIDSISGYRTSVVALTLGSRLSGEVARFVARTVGDEEGNVATRAGGVAADDEGDVAAGADVVAATSD
jgi:hypothetical protein